MSSLRIIAVVLAVLLHGTVVYGLSYHNKEIRLQSLSTDSGNDLLTVEQGIAIEGLAKLGDALETIETPEVKAVEEAIATPPVQEVKTEELRDVVTAKDSNLDDNIVKTEEPPPVETPPPPKPEAVAAIEQPAETARVEEKSSGAELKGSNATAKSEYLRAVFLVISKNLKLDLRLKHDAKAELYFTVGMDGRLLSHAVRTTSGSEAVDAAALAALERAARLFPPIPPDASTGPIAMSLPLELKAVKR